MRVKFRTCHFNNSLNCPETIIARKMGIFGAIPQNFECCLFSIIRTKCQKIMKFD